MAKRRLLHYSAEPLGDIYDVPRQPLHFKPVGLWLSVEGEDDWPSWCRGTVFNLDRLACVHEITLKRDASILRLSSSADIDELTRRYHKPPESASFVGITSFIDWSAIADQHDGIIIAPYIWSRRLSVGAAWYYAWDCASGCIWRARAIERVERLVQADDAAPGNRALMRARREIRSLTGPKSKRADG